ncbi:MAG: hypothetical protein WC364_06805, partial [Eubacteriales bacterium]
IKLSRNNISSEFMVISKVYNWNFISKNLTKTIIRGEKDLSLKHFFYTAFCFSFFSLSQMGVRLDL